MTEFPATAETRATCRWNDTGAPYTAPRAGRLTCFANDVPGFYWNNRGAIRLSVALR